VPFPSNEQVETMLVALDLACIELGISVDDIDNRERVTAAIITLSQAGQDDAGQIKSYAVYRYRTLHS
jgi:hypothetical protein